MAKASTGWTPSGCGRRAAGCSRRRPPRSPASRPAGSPTSTRPRCCDERSERAELETWLSLADNGDGTFSGRFVIPELHGHLLRGPLEQLTSPRQLSRNRAGEVVRRRRRGRPGPDMSGTEKLGLGFTELIEHLPTSSDGIAGGFTRNA